MEYIQERITTLHNFSINRAPPTSPTSEAAIIIPMTQREQGSLAADRVLQTLETIGVGQVFPAISAEPENIGDVLEWIDSYELPTESIWCNGPHISTKLEQLSGESTAGKGRDIWIALGLAREYPYIAVHDADTLSYSDTHVPRLLYPLNHDFNFSKAYYARVEHQRLFGRLYRLFYAPLLRAISLAYEHPIFEYLEAFRYPLSGDFAATQDFVDQLSVPPNWGVEIATMGAGYRYCGFDHTAQVDLDNHRHDHRAVRGPSGLATMADEVGQTLLHIIEREGVEIDYSTLTDRYLHEANRLIRQYAADAEFNQLDYDRSEEQTQVNEYATALQRRDELKWLPAWSETPLSFDELYDAVDKDRRMARE